MRPVREKIRLSVEFIKRRPYLIGLLAIVVVLGASYVLSRLTPNRAQTQAITAPDIVSTKVPADFSKVTVIPPQTYPQIPATLAVYTATQTTISTTQLISQFELQPTEYPNRYSNVTLHRLLTYDPTSMMYTYLDSAHEGSDDPAIGMHIQASQALQVATLFVQNELHLIGYTPVLTGIQYYKKEDAEEAEPLSVDQANLAEIPFSSHVDGKESYVGTSAYVPLRVYVDSTNKIVSFRLYQNGFTVGTATTVPTITANDIVSGFKSGKVDVLRMYGSTTDQFALQNLKDITLDDISIQYRFVASSQQAIPYFFISGTVTYTNNLDPMKIEFILPAVRTSAKQ